MPIILEVVNGVAVSQSKITGRNILSGRASSASESCLVANRTQMMRVDQGNQDRFEQLPVGTAKPPAQLQTTKQTQSDPNKVQVQPASSKEN